MFDTIAGDLQLADITDTVAGEGARREIEMKIRLIV